MRVNITHSIGDLERDARAIPAKAARKMVGVVKKNTTEGRKLAQGFARTSSGPHGTAYYKRITDEMLSPFVGEYGPNGDVVGNAVGGGWRHGPPNTDLPRSADIQGPKFAKDMGDVLDGLFW